MPDRLSRSQDAQEVSDEARISILERHVDSLEFDQPDQGVQLWLRTIPYLFLGIGVVIVGTGIAILLGFLPDDALVQSIPIIVHYGFAGIAIMTVLIWGSVWVAKLLYAEPEWTNYEASSEEANPGKE